MLLILGGLWHQVVTRPLFALSAFAADGRKPIQLRRIALSAWIALTLVEVLLKKTPRDTQP